MDTFFYCSSKYNNYNSYHITYLDMYMHTYIHTKNYTIDTVVYSNDMLILIDKYSRTTAFSNKIERKMHYKVHLSINFFKVVLLLQMNFSVSYLIFTLTIKLSIFGSTSPLLQLHKKNFPYEYKIIQ